MSSNSIEQYWRLAGVPVDAHDGPEPIITPSESYDFHAVTTQRSDVTESEWEGALDRYRTLLAYGRRAGQYDLHDYGNGTYGYTQTHDGAVPRGSLLVELRPPADSVFGHGGWFLIESVEDNSTLESYLHLSLSLVYLAPLALEVTDPGYQDRSAVSSALEADPL